MKNWHVISKAMIIVAEPFRDRAISCLMKNLVSHGVLKIPVFKNNFVSKFRLLRRQYSNNSQPTSIFI